MTSLARVVLALDPISHKSIHSTSRSPMASSSMPTYIKVVQIHGKGERGRGTRGGEGGLFANFFDP